MKVDKKVLMNEFVKPTIKKLKGIENTVEERVKHAPAKVKKGVLIAMFVLPTLGIVKNCTNSEQIGNYPEYIYNPTDTTQRSNYIDVTEKTTHTVKKGENPDRIAREHNVSTRRFLIENGLKKSDYIYENQVLSVPESQKVVNVETLDDVAKLTGFSTEYLTDLCDMEKVRYEAYKDRNNNSTIGVGHYIKDYEKEKFNKTLDDKEVYTLLGQDLIDADLDLKAVMSEDSYYAIPQCIKESVMDLMFNKGPGAVIDNENIISGLEERNYEKVVANLTQDYSVVVNAKGEKIKKPSSGLSKRRLYDISRASRYFKNDVPKSVMESANDVYQRGLVYMQQEKDRGEISAEAYPNVLAEYKDLAYQWFGGKIGEKRTGVSASNSNKQEVNAEQKTTETAPAPKAPSVSVPKDKENIQIHIDGGKRTTWTYGKLYEEWEKTAARQLRPFKRPLPEIDAKGNIVATVKELDPTGTGAFLGKTIIVNSGHGGCMNHEETGKKGKVLNVNFDPGTSNAVMSAKNPNVETNEFIGNNGKPLEEWYVNMKISEDLAEKIRAQGGRVIYVQGSVYSARDAIRKVVGNKKANMLISLHSNSSVGRGIYVMRTNRNGGDPADKVLAQKIENRMNEDSWFRGLVTDKSASLDVLSKDPSHPLDIPAVLIETGNLKDKTDIANLNSRDFRSRMVDAIINGMKDYK